MDWYRMVDSGWQERAHFVAHIIPDNLLSAIMTDLKERGLGSHSVTATSEEGFDMPGMVWTKRHIYKIQLPGLVFETPAEDVSTFVSELSSLKVRHVGGMPYYKMHCFMRCICLTPELRDDLLAKLRGLESEAEGIAEAEHQMQMAAIQRRTLNPC